jgi:hypothetical protein
MLAALKRHQEALAELAALQVTKVKPEVSHRDVKSTVFV